MTDATLTLHKRQLQAQRRLQQQGDTRASCYLKNTPPRQDQPHRDTTSAEQQQSAQNQ